jgi:hypothetical protein
MRPIHLAHPALADQREDFIGAESVADRKRHISDNGQFTSSGIG